MKKTTMLIKLALILVAASCGPDTSNLKVSSETVSFKEFCNLAGMPECGKSTLPPPSQDIWNAGLTTFKTIVDSPSKFELSREQFDRESVKNLIALTGGTEIIDFFKSLPWEDLTISQNVITLRNNRRKPLEVNGFNFYADFKTEVTLTTNARYQTTGLFFSTEMFGMETVEYVDLSKPAKVTFITDKRTLTDVPLEYLIPNRFPTDVALEVIQQPTADITVDKLIRSITDVMFETGYEWFNMISVYLENDHIRTIKELSYDEVMKNPFNEAIVLALDNAKSLVIGGPTKSPLRVEIANQIKCKMHFKNVPVLGSPKASLKFEKSFGITSAKKEKGGKVIADIDGISTTLGNVRYIELDGDEVSLKIGQFTVPLTLEPQEKSGPELTKVECKEDD